MVKKTDNTNVWKNERKPRRDQTKVKPKNIWKVVKVLVKNPNATQREIGQFLYYYHSQSVVTPCVIDSIKDRLVAEGKMKLKKSDNFGLLCRPEFHDK